MSVNVVDNRERHRFEAEIDGMPAFAEYEMSGNTMILTHTVVPSSHQGEGVGEALARAALDSARAHNYRVEPRCTYMAAFIKRHREYQDLVDS
jgi:predicted GNAT family acetyltransferase